LLHSLLSVQPTFVPFNGAAPAMNTLLGGQVDHISNAIPDSVPHVQSGTVKVSAISRPKRSPALPNGCVRHASANCCNHVSTSGFYPGKVHVIVSQQ
jgi:hypothetical protein